MTNHAIVALERVRDELSDDRRGLPRVTRSYQCPAPRSVTPHHSRRHPLRCPSSRRRREFTNESGNWRRKQNSAKAFGTPFPGAINTVFGHQASCKRPPPTTIPLKVSDRAAEQATRTRAAVASPAIMWRKVLVGSLAMASGAAAFAPAAAPALSRAHTGALLLHNPRVSRRVQPQPTEFWRAIAVTARASQRSQCVRSENERRGTKGGPGGASTAQVSAACAVLHDAGQASLARR